MRNVADINFPPPKVCFVELFLSWWTDFVYPVPSKPIRCPMDKRENDFRRQLHICWSRNGPWAILSQFHKLRGCLCASGKSHSKSKAFAGSTVISRVDSQSSHVPGWNTWGAVQQLCRFNCLIISCGRAAALAHSALSHRGRKRGSWAIEAWRRAARAAILAFELVATRLSASRIAMLREGPRPCGGRLRHGYVEIL
jgi:hypothetical protein